MTAGAALKTKVKSGRKHAISVVKFVVKEYTDDTNDKSSAQWPQTDKSAERWIYVFSVESWGVRLCSEAKVEGSQKYKLVDWKTKKWAGKNKREPSKTVSEFSVRTPVGGPDETGIFVVLSPIQLPRVRIDQYVGSNASNPKAAKLVRRRGTKIKIGDTAVRDEQSGLTTVYVREPITIADKLAAEFAIACREYRKHLEKDIEEYNLASAALSALKEVLKHEDDFVSDGKFNQNAAQKVITDFDKKTSHLKNKREKLGKRFASATGCSEYDEALKDYDGDNALEDERIRIRARHAANKMQSAATRALMEREVKDDYSWINRYLFSETLFNSMRKMNTLVAEFGDILGEYGNIFISVRGHKSFLLMLEKTVLYRVGFNIAAFRVSYPVGTITVTTYDVKRMATNPTFSGKLAGKAQRLLIAFEVLNLAMAWDAFSKKSKKELSDYAGPTGSLCDLAGAVGSRVATVIEKSERELAASLGKEVYKESDKLVVLTRVMAVIGIVGGICDMVEARSGALDAAKTLQYERIIGYSAMYLGAALGVHAAGMSLAGAAGAGPVGLIAIGLVLLGVLIIYWFQESDLETWLRNSQWGDRYTGKNRIEQLQELDYILARFQPSLEYMDLKSAGWGGWIGSMLRVTINPGFVNAKSKFHVEVQAWCIVGSFGSIDKEDVITIDKRVVAVKIGKDGKPKPISFDINLASNPALIKLKAAGFKQRIRVYAQLQLDDKRNVPKKDRAWWWFFFDHGEKKFKVTNFKFD